MIEDFMARIWFGVKGSSPVGSFRYSAVSGLLLMIAMTL